jgi:hypothetical protein
LRARSVLYGSFIASWKRDLWKLLAERKATVIDADILRANSVTGDEFLLHLIRMTPEKLFAVYPGMAEAVIMVDGGLVNEEFAGKLGMDTEHVTGQDVYLAFGTPVELLLAQNGSGTAWAIMEKYLRNRPDMAGYYIDELNALSTAYPQAGRILFEHSSRGEIYGELIRPAAATPMVSLGNYAAWPAGDLTVGSDVRVRDESDLLAMQLLLPGTRKVDLVTNSVNEIRTDLWSDDRHTLEIQLSAEKGSVIHIAHASPSRAGMQALVNETLSRRTLHEATSMIQRHWFTRQLPLWAKTHGFEFMTITPLVSSQAFVKAQGFKPRVDSIAWIKSTSETSFPARDLDAWNPFQLDWLLSGRMHLMGGRAAIRYADVEPGIRTEEDISLNL